MELPGVSRLLYVSQALVDPCGSDPRDILQVSTARNTALGVTGVLCFSGDHFVQLLEGASEALYHLMGSIRGDVRHRMVREWPAEAAEDGRWFPGWAMGYVYDARLELLAHQLSGADVPQGAVSQWARPLFGSLELYRGRIL